MHFYELNGYSIVIDPISGSVHVTDRASSRVIALIKDHTDDQIERIILREFGSDPDVTPQAVRECVRAARDLMERGKIWAGTDLKPLAGVLKERSGDVVKALCLDRKSVV